MLQRVKEESSPDAVAIAFDLRGSTFRHKEYEGYKAQRKGMPEELAQQLPMLKELLTALGYQIVTCEGYEADDILGDFRPGVQKPEMNASLPPVTGTACSWFLRALVYVWPVRNLDNLK